MYCHVNEAFDTSFNKQLDKFNSIQDKIVRCNQNPSFFDLQGDFKREKGTCIKDLPNQQTNISEECNPESILSFPSIEQSFDDSLDSLDFKLKELIDDPNKKQKINHKYYINQFIHNIADDTSDISSMTSGSDEAYNHIRSCKYCKSQINTKMKSYYNNEFKNKAINNNNQLNHNNNQLNNNNNNKFGLTNDNIMDKVIGMSNVAKTVKGYDVIEILLIILFGVFIIFILDLFVRLGKNIKD